jgi:hypothetical protein
LLRERLFERIGVSSTAGLEPALDDTLSDHRAHSRAQPEMFSLRALTTMAAALILVALAAIAVLVADIPAPVLSETHLATPMTPVDDDDAESMLSFDSRELFRFVNSCFELVTLQPPTPEAMQSGRLLWDSTNQICYVYTPALPPACEGDVYHLWFTPRESDPVPVAEFDVDPDGRACVHVDLPDQHATFASASIRRGPVGDPSRAVNDILMGTFRR